MKLFLSTSFNSDNSNLKNTLNLIKDLDLDGIEIGSNHSFDESFYDIIKSCNFKKILIHNYFPPMKNNNIVINLASNNKDIRDLSIKHALCCIEFASQVGAKIYTVHPGFLSEPKIKKVNIKRNYDYNFSKIKISKSTGFKNMVNSLEILIKKAQDLGVILAIESEGSFTSKNVLLLETINEFEDLFATFPNEIKINFNLAHTRIASKIHNYSLTNFIEKFNNNIVAVELSDNSGLIDEHLPLKKNSFVFDYINKLPNIPMILEFRDANINQIKKSIDLMRNYEKLN